MQIELIDGSVLVDKHFAADVVQVDKRMVAMISSEGVDTDGDVMHAGRTKNGAGWLLDTYNRNPIITWSHDRISRPNIGSADVRARVGKTDDGQRGLFLDPFSFDMPDPFAAEIAGKYERKVLKQTSVGAVATKFDIRREGDIVAGREYFEQRLIEVACVNVGANQDTNVLMKSMLGMHGLSAKVQGGGDRELAELKRELDDLRKDYEQDIRDLQNVVKRFSDENSGGQDAAAVVKSAAIESAAKVDGAALAILLRLKQLGTAN